MRKPLIAGNWKMYGSAEKVRSFIKDFSVPEEAIASREILICPPFTSLATWREHSAAKPYLQLGAQDVYWEKDGAFTGEISPVMLKDAGCAYCVVGHSERRQYFGETDVSVNRKMHALLEAGVKPIVCVGETLKEREAGKTEEVLRRQINCSVFALDDAAYLKEIVIAYEPVWAIGTGKTATSEQANEACGFIRLLLRDRLGAPADDSIRILYGGSVNPKNIDELMALPEVDGVLVGGASLKAADFSRIAAYEV
ncbi:MAG: triose-phosphate isomerase [bacterium]